jgi:hypothetical protein
MIQDGIPNLGWVESNLIMGRPDSSMMVVNIEVDACHQRTF